MSSVSWLYQLDEKFWQNLRRLYWPTIALALLLALAAVVWAFGIEPNQLTIQQTTIPLPDWPATMPPLKIVALSDLHIGAPHISLEKLQFIVQRANEQQPDLVVLLGDFVIQGVVGGKFVAPEIFAPYLKNLQARYGVYAVLGNHDWNYDGDRVAQALTQAGIKVMTNDATKIATANGDFWLAGVGDFFTHHHDLEQAFRNLNAPAPIIVMTHTPDVFLQYPIPVSLTLAGHTHGGQINLPLLGRRVVPSDHGEKFAVGLIEEGEKKLFVTSGIGTSILPVRFRVPPEIAVLTLTTKTP